MRYLLVVAMNYYECSVYVEQIAFSLAKYCQSKHTWLDAACIVACLDDNDDNDDEMRWWDGDDDEDDDDGDSDENMMMMRWWRWQWGLWWWWHPHIPPPCPSQFLLGQTSLMCESYSVMCIIPSFHHRRFHVSSSLFSSLWLSMSVDNNHHHDHNNYRDHDHCIIIVLWNLGALNGFSNPFPGFTPVPISAIALLNRMMMMIIMTYSHQVGIWLVGICW